MAHPHAAHGSAAAHDHGHGSAHGAGHDGHAHFAHATPVWQLAAVFGALLVLTIMTVSTGMLGLGEYEIVASLGIAFVKATLVALFFMHLIYDKPFNVMLFTFSLAFIALFIGFTAMDSQTYRPLVEAREDDVPFQRPPIEGEVVAAEVAQGGAPGDASMQPEAHPQQTSNTEHTGQP
ncbi:MAG TPA: cytochrome C oxidase subunit IV family protein [Pirellulaceae bacterium]|jgi:cytochrome c oxidase subunit 4|nr:cytochrome C oxidase subunit IV family protein [Pirellulaceae bacterium]